MIYKDIRDNVSRETLWITCNWQNLPITKKTKLRYISLY